MEEALKELEKYKKIMKQEGKGYGGYNHAKHYYRNISDILSNYSSVADIGCGDGKFTQWIKEQYKDYIVYGIDPAFIDEGFVNGVEYKTGCTFNIPLDDNSVDVLTAFDVLEHIHPTAIDESLKEINRVCKHVFMGTIASHSCKQIHCGEMMELHPTQKSIDWWIDKIKQYFNDVFIIGKFFIAKKEGK